MKKTQEQIIINKLNADGQVSRNWALQHFISRLGAITCSLVKNGWEFEAKYEKTNNGKDFVYKVIKSPYVKEEYFVPELNRTIIKYTKV